MTTAEKMVCEARGSGVSFEDMDKDDREVASDEIMLRIASICGCALPNTDFFAKYISEEIEHFIMKFGYSGYTLEEIILAFRLNSGGYGVGYDHVQFTGVCVNVDFIAKVLINYSEVRKTLENKIKNKIDGYEL